MNPVLSKTFSWLRFPLIVGVVFIHAFASFEAGSYWFENVSYFLSEIVSRLSVPIFFLISGYLFFNTDKFDKSIYNTKVKSRVRSLLIPYLCWNTFVVIFLFTFLFLLIKIPSTAQFISWFNMLFKDKSIIQIIIDTYWHSKANVSPIAYQFWFIRDLFIVVLFSPIVYLLIKYLRLFVVVVLGVLWYFNLSPIAIPSMAAIFFFSSGAYIRIYKKDDILLNFKSLLSKISLVYPVVAILNIFFRNPYIHDLGIILGVILVFNIVSYFVQRDKLHTNEFLANASFFVFAFHEPLLTIVKKIYLKLIPATNAFMPVVEYFGQVIAIILLSLIVYKLINKYLPKLSAVLTGGR